MHREMLSQVNRAGLSRPSRAGPARARTNGPRTMLGPSHPFWTGSRPRRASGANLALATSHRPPLLGA